MLNCSIINGLLVIILHNLILNYLRNYDVDVMVYIY